MICYISQIKYTNRCVYYYRDISKANFFVHYVSAKVFTVRTSSLNKPICSCRRSSSPNHQFPSDGCTILFYLHDARTHPPQWIRTSSLSRLYNLTQLDTTQSVDTSGRAISSTQTLLLDKTHHSKHTFILAHSQIRVRNSSKLAAADPRSRPRRKFRHNDLLGVVNEAHRFSWCIGPPAQQLLVFLQSVHRCSDLKTVNFEVRQDIPRNQYEGTILKSLILFYFFLF